MIIRLPCSRPRAKMMKWSGCRPAPSPPSAKKWTASGRCAVASCVFCLPRRKDRFYTRCALCAHPRLRRAAGFAGECGGRGVVGFARAARRERVGCRAGAADVCVARSLQWRVGLLGVFSRQKNLLLYVGLVVRVPGATARLAVFLCGAR